MKIIALGDTHGRNVWKEIVLKEEPFDKIVFIGDYWDSFDIPYEEQAKNFLDICEYKKDNINKVVLLIGNHDFHYLDCIRDTGESYSGFQGNVSSHIGFLLEENKKLFQAAYEYKNFLFTHAGVTQTWLECNNFNVKELTIADAINEIFNYRPEAFRFEGYNPYGDDITQSPIWVRPKSLMEDAKKFKKQIIQIVGHTGQNCIDEKGKSTGGRYYFIDTLGSSKEYLIIENDLIIVGKISNNSVG